MSAFSQFSPSHLLNLMPLLVGSETDGAFIIDANVTYDVGTPLYASSDSYPLHSGTLNVMVEVTSSSAILLSNVSVPVNSTGTVIPFFLSALPPSSSPYTVSCSATFETQTFTASSKVYNLPPNPYIANVSSTTSVATKVDRRSGAMLRVDKESGEWKPFLPYGFYTGFSDVIANLSIIDQMVQDGYVFSLYLECVVE